ncbi:hypothetical protein FRC17_006032 [Serendipita sp. 399]|nr:hypothetical protein FRC17_006032 [Serendipita sp. 399]
MRTNAKERAKQTAATYGTVGGALAPPMPDAQGGGGGSDAGAGTTGGGGGLSPMSGANVVAMARKSSMMKPTGSGRRPHVMQDFEKGGAGAGAGTGGGTDLPVKSAVSIQITEAPTDSHTPQAAKPPASTTTAGGKHKPATFQEMGYQSHKLEDKDCIIICLGLMQLGPSYAMSGEIVRAEYDQICKN